MTTKARTAMQSRPTLIIPLLLAITAWPGSAAFAASDTPRSPKAKRHSMETAKPLQAARPRQPVACAEFGPGFVRMPGSNSCIRMGGGVGLDVGAVP